MMKEQKKEKINPIFIAIAVIALFVFIISFTAFYTKENFSSVCGCQLPIWVIIISISSFGLFTGSLIYYLLNQNISKERKNVKDHLHKILNFLDSDEKKILRYLIDNSGEVYQSKISKDLELDKVKVSRLINKLVLKKIIFREKRGMTNYIVLDSDLKEIF